MCRDVAKVVFSPSPKCMVARAALHLRHIGPAAQTTITPLLIERLISRMGQGCVSGLGAVC